MRQSLKKHTGSAEDWIADNLIDSEKLELVFEYLTAIKDKEISVDKLEYVATSDRKILQQHDRNEFHRPKGLALGQLFRGDY